MATDRKIRFHWVWWVLASGLLIFHPWLFGLPGRIGEIRLERALRSGMSRPEVVTLKDATGADPRTYLGSSQTFEDVQSGALMMPYVDWITLCVEGGKLYVVYFDKDNHVRSWRSEDWEYGC